MRESRPYGSVRGARGNSRPYRYGDAGCISSVAKFRDFAPRAATPKQSGVRVDHISVRLCWAWARLLAMGFGGLIEHSHACSSPKGCQEDKRDEERRVPRQTGRPVAGRGPGRLFLFGSRASHCCRRKTYKNSGCSTTDAKHQAGMGFSRGPRVDTACHPCDGIPWRHQALLSIPGRYRDTSLHHLQCGRQRPERLHPFR
jgi:hypothetical protein